MFIKIITICFYFFLGLFLLPIPALASLNAIAATIAGVCAFILAVVAMQ